jgi:phage terminase large subunit GpA-like protein
MQDVTWKGRLDKKGVMVHSVGTIEIKHVLFARLKNDAADKDLEDRFIHFSEDLPDDYFAGIVSETYDRQKKRYVKKPGIRNEPLDTLVYAYAALHHQTIRAHRFTDKDWQFLAYVLNNAGQTSTAAQQQRNTRPKEDIERERGRSFSGRFKGRFSGRGRSGRN